MNISKHSMVTPNEILSDATMYCDEEDFKIISRGFFLSLLQRSMQELAFDTFFDERTEFFDVPENLNLDMPKGSFNIKQIYLLNGDNCGNIDGTQNVYWKRNYFTKGNGYLSRNKISNNNDPFYDNMSTGNIDGANPSLRRTGVTRSIKQAYYYNVQSGTIMLSSTCKAYNRIAIVFNGVGADIGEVPFVPMMFREAIVSWIVDNALQVKLTKLVGTAAFNGYQTIWSINNNKLNKPFDGLWADAQYRAKSMDSKQREDIKEYIGRLGY